MFRNLFHGPLFEEEQKERKVPGWAKKLQEDLEELKTAVLPPKEQQGTTEVQEEPPVTQQQQQQVQEQNPSETNPDQNPAPREKRRNKLGVVNLGMWMKRK